MFNFTAVQDFDPKQFVDQLGLPHVDLSRLDPTNLDLTRFDVRNIDLPRFDMPTIDMPTIDLPDVDRIAGMARDAAYVGIGAAVIAAQKTDTARRQLTDQITAAVAPLIDSVPGRTKA